MFAEARKICEQSVDFCAATNADIAMLFHRRSTKPLRDAPNVLNSPQVPQVPSSSRTQPEAETKHCYSCGEYRLRSTCRFRNAFCHACDENSSPFYTLQTTEPNGQFVFAPLRFESGVERRFIMDTGSSESILPKSALNAICPNAILAPTSKRIHGVTGRQLQLLGETMLRVKSASGVSIPIRFLVSAHSSSILGLRAMRLLQGSITLHTNNDMPITSRLQHLIVQCFDNVGGMKVPSVKLEVDGESIFLKRRVLPYGQREGVLKAIQKMEQDGVISKVESSAWATPIVVAMKSDGRTPRICGDYRLTLNPRLRRCAATTMEPEDFMKALHGCQYFSKIDLADAYLQIPLDVESRYLTTINMPWGMYQYNSLPFGLRVSSGLFQSAIDSVIEGLDGVLAYQDDVLIFGLNKKEHDDRLTQVLERFASRNVAIKPSKCVFGVSELEFLRFTVDSRGYRPDPTLFKPLTNIESPKDQTNLRSVMGCLQYYSRFIPKFAKSVQPLFRAQCSDAWEWSAECEDILRGSIRCVTERPVLARFHLQNRLHSSPMHLTSESVLY
ncbi:unnamed protein product [Echinostoma caproni]|uniref:Reverse transcriptase domain-containing protein n=1 Tax=Echinostoma caproni TaxID=27848 RepID=A0A183B0U5_9TREM|nr:unnamed protein product [Echinostoma caproni]